MVRGKWFTSALAVILSVSLVLWPFGTAAESFADTAQGSEIGTESEESTDRDVDGVPEDAVDEDFDGQQDDDSPESQDDSQKNDVDDTGETDVADNGQNEEGLEDDAGEAVLLENSWRYSDGELIPFASARASSNAWKKDSNGNYLNSNGKVIDGAVKKGIDVSEHNKKIDWAKVKASGDIDFAIIRCGFGDDYTNQDDKYWLYNVQQCKKYNIPFGVYIYSYAYTVDMALSEAEHVLRCLKEAGVGASQLAYPVFFDLEEENDGKPAVVTGSSKKKTVHKLSNALLANMSTVFCDRVEKAGYEAGVYANLNWWNNYLTNSVFDQWTRWVAQYNYQCDYRKEYAFWQCTSSGSVAGVSGHVDINFQMKSYDIVVGERTLEPGTYYLETKKASNKVVDIASGSMVNGGNAQLYSWNGTDAQKFNVTIDENNLYTFVNVKSGKVLDVENGAAKSGTNVQQYSNNSTKAQKWKLIKQNDGSYIVVSALNSNLVLDIKSGKTADKTNIQVYQKNGTAAQKFEFDPVVTADASSLSNGVYSIGASYADGKVLDIASGSYSNGANVQLYASNKTAAQKFYIAKGKDGFYTIRSLSSGKLLDAAGGKLASPCNVQQWSAASNERNQQWSITDNEDGTRTFINRANGLALDVASASSSNGANIQLYKLNGTKAQKFTVRQVDPLENGSKIRLSSALNTGKGLDVKGGSKSSGANVQLYAWNGTAAQKFEVVKNGDYYSLKALCSGMYLSVSGTNVVQSSNGSSKASLWKPVVGGHGMTFQNAATGKVLDVSGGKTANGTNVQVYKSNGTAAQGFVVKTV